MKNKSKKSKIGTIIKIVFFIITIPILVMSAIIMIKAKMYPNKVPDIFGYKPMIVLSGSMETSIYTGDLVFVKNVDTSTLKEQDVIAFRNESDTVTTHRIVDIVEQDGQQYFQTKGDNNDANDADLVSMDDVEGIYVFKIPKLGSALMVIKEPKSLAVILLVILVLGLIWLNVADKKEKAKMQVEDDKYRKEFEKFKKMKQQEERQNGKQE